MPRIRKPQQERSQKTVDAIVLAGFMVVKTAGLKGLTTRRIAETAGVGVGSVYEYFENKDAIIAAMNQQMTDELIAHLKPRTAEWAQLDMRTLIITLLNELRDFFKADNGKYAAYIARQNPHELQVAFRRINALLEDLVVRYLLNHPEHAQAPDLPLISYIAIHGGVAVISKHLGEKEPLFDYDQLVIGLADMVQAMIDRAS